MVCQASTCQAKCNQESCLAWCRLCQNTSKTWLLLIALLLTSSCNSLRERGDHIAPHTAVWACIDAWSAFSNTYSPPLPLARCQPIQRTQLCGTNCTTMCTRPVVLATHASSPQCCILMLLVSITRWVTARASLH